MSSRICQVGLISVITASVLLADFSYQQTTRVTGGALAAGMKMAAVFSKQARGPMESTVAVKGDRMLHLSPTHVTVIDLGKETITSIDLQKKTYSVETFAQMQQAMEQMSQKMKEKQKDNQNSAEMNYKVSVNPTGQSKDIGGMPAKEFLVTMEMQATDPESGQSGAMVMTMDTWVAPKVAGYEEITDFYKRMWQKIGWMPGQMSMGRSDMAKGMTEMAKELSKMDGMPVYTTTRMGGQGTQAQASQPGAPPADQPKQAQGPSAGSVLGGALGGRFGLGRRKAQPAQEQPQSSSGSQPPAQGNAGLLMEMVSESNSFSAAPLDPAKFEVPAGFKQVVPPGSGR